MAEAQKKPGFIIDKNREDYVISHWPLAFRKGDAPAYVRLPNSGASPNSTADQPGSSDIALALNAVYEDVYVKQVSDGLIIIGPKERVRRIKTMLAKWIDVPFPQVQLNVLSFQAAARNYNAGKISDAVEMANAGIVVAREFMQAYYNDFAGFVADASPRILNSTISKDEKLNELFSRFHLVGYEPYDSGQTQSLQDGRRRIMPFVDDLAYLAFADGSTFRDQFQKHIRNGVAQTLLDSLEQQLHDQQAQLDLAFSKGQVRADQVQRGKDLNDRLLNLCESLRRSTKQPLPAFNRLLSGNDFEASGRLLTEFMYEYSLPNTYFVLDPIKDLGRDVAARDRELASIREGYAKADKELDGLRRLRNIAENAIPTLQQRALELELKDNNQDEVRKAKRSAAARLAAANAEKAQLATTLKALQKVAKKSKGAAAEALKSNISKIKKKIESAKQRADDAQKILDDKNGGVETLESRVTALKSRLTTLQKDAKEISTRIDELQKSQLELKTNEDRLLRTRDALQAEWNRTTAPASKFTPTRPVDPEALTMLSANVDELIKKATDAFSQDMDAAVIQPLRAWIEENNRGKKDGLVFTGNVGLAVTSSRGAASGGLASFATPYTPQQTLSADNLTSLFTAGEGLSLFSSQGMESILKVAQALGQSTTTFATVAPGLDLAVRPSVLPGGRSARLVVNFRTGVEVTDAEGSKRPPINHVASHETSSDVAVNAFDLFPLSTFSAETTALGDPQWRIYGLEGLPILGNMFIGPRRPVTSTGRAVVIVYTTILPRSLDIARRYAPSSN